MPPKDEPKQDPHAEVGRKLFAAILSAQLRIRSVDYTLRCYVPEAINACWGELGWKLQCDLAASVSRQLREAHERERGIHLVVDNTDLPF